MIKSITVKHKYYDTDNDLCESQVKISVYRRDLVRLTVPGSTAYLPKKKVLETAQALNYLATTMEDEE